MVVAGEGIDEPGGIFAALQPEGGQPETGRPPLRPLDQAPDVWAVEVDPELVQQRRGLVHSEGELVGANVGDHALESEPVQRPRWILARRGDEPKASWWALHQAQQALVDGE